MDQTLEAPQAPPQNQSQSIAVDIYDQVYNLRGTDPAYIERLATIVDAKMRAVSAHGNTVDSLRVAVLAALNIADELCTARQRHENLAGSPELAALHPHPRHHPRPHARRGASKTAR